MMKELLSNVNTGIELTAQDDTNPSEIPPAMVNKDGNGVSLPSLVEVVQSEPGDDCGEETRKSEEIFPRAENFSIPDRRTAFSARGAHRDKDGQGSLQTPQPQPLLNPRLFELWYKSEIRPNGFLRHGQEAAIGWHKGLEVNRRGDRDAMKPLRQE
ncbi:hypothetical protein KL933_004667 [Ogataea haglerorum]|uniref:Uncharacterized protein n=1 Tax=Ogataea haglerorum TaxID=1937702 RepID=A0AAN6D207_9ASCO|nr:hypothetical protein KL933_004667 [Ogataea haglerorum]